MNTTIRSSTSRRLGHWLGGGWPLTEYVAEHSGARTWRYSERARALAAEHTEVAQMNLRQALQHRNESDMVLPAMRLVVGR